MLDKNSKSPEICATHDLDDEAYTLLAAAWVQHMRLLYGDRPRYCEGERVVGTDTTLAPLPPSEKETVCTS